MHGIVRPQIPRSFEGAYLMVALRKSAFNDLVVDYDRDADVLYITSGPPRPGYGDEGEDDIIFRFAESDGVPIGATIVGYEALDWPQRRFRLYKIVANHLRLAESEVASAFAVAGV